MTSLFYILIIGILLAATAVDANGSLFPFAWAVVDIENNENWLWFLHTLHQIIEDNAPEFLRPAARLTFLSDRQKGIIEAVSDKFPSSPHGYCLKHLEQCFKNAGFKSPELCAQLWKIARATTQEAFDTAVRDMQGMNMRAWEWLQTNASPEHWAELFFEGRRYGHLTSNISESLNSWLLPARELPVLPMLELIRQKIMQWFAERRRLEDGTRGFLVSKRAKEIQQIVNKRARRYRCLESTNTVYEVESKETLHNYRVDLATHSCTCRDWRATGLPCGHACAVILARREDPQLYADRFYTLAEYKATYNNPIFQPNGDGPNGEENFNWTDYLNEMLQFNDEDDDEDHENSSADEDLLPPNTRRPVGRPKKKRIRHTFEEDVPTRVFRCSRCKGLGHSRRTCRAAI